MLQDIFYWTFNMSLVASLTGGLIVLIRRIRQLPRRFAVMLWVVPFLRMAVPYGLNSPYSLMALLSKITTKTVVVYQPAEGITFSATNCIMAADTYFPITYKTSLLETAFAAASVLWVIVLVAILLVLTTVYVTTHRDTKGAAHLRDNIYLSEKVLSPAIYGIIKPKILLPVSYRERDLTLILLHEEAHIRRGDNLWRALALLIVSVHWFNPFCWVFLKLFLSDLELACDESVLTTLGSSRAKEYALTLLESKQGSPAFASAFGGAKIRPRIERILSFKRMTRFSSMVFTALILIILHVLLTNAG